MRIHPVQSQKSQITAALLHAAPRTNSPSQGHQVPMSTHTDNLKWHNHIDMITTKSLTTLGFIKRTIQPQSSQLRIRAYKQLVRPVLKYASGTPSRRPSVFKSKLSNKDLHGCFLTFPVSAGNQPLSSSENLTGHRMKNEEVTDWHASSELCTLLR